MNVVNSTKKLIGATATSSPLKPLLRRILRPRANVAYYHFVGKTEPFYKEFSGNCSLKRFEQDLGLLKTYFDLVSVQEIVDLHELGRTPDAPVLAITFDDGFDLVRGGAMEILDRHGVKATVFLITSCINNQNLMWRNKISAMMNSVPPHKLLAAYNDSSFSMGVPPVTDVQEIPAASMLWPMRNKESLVDSVWAACGMLPVKDYLAKYQPYMTWDDLEIWRSHGHGIGLHTHTHPVCSALEEDLVTEEINKPAERLKQQFGLTDLLFSYPFGAHLPATTENQLLDNGTLQAVFGIKGSVHFDSSRRRLERAGIEKDVKFPLFGKALLNAARST